MSLATQSDLAIEAQVSSPGANWLDRQILAKDSSLISGGFGADVRDALDRRADHLVDRDLPRRQGQRVAFARDLLNALRRRELNEAVIRPAVDAGFAYRPSAKGEHVSGIYRQRVTLGSGRFVMIDDGMRFQLAPWCPALEEQLGRHVYADAERKRRSELRPKGREIRSALRCCTQPSARLEPEFNSLDYQRNGGFLDA